MRRLSVLTSKEIDGLKEEFDNFKKRTSAEVKMAWNEVEAHERELTRQQEMYRSMLSEYYSAIEARKSIDIQNMKFANEIVNQSAQDSKPQTLNISHINIGNFNFNKSSKQKITGHSKSLHYGKTSKADIKNEFPKIQIQTNKKLISSSMNFSPSFKNEYEMRKTMKGVVNAEEKQFRIMNKYLKHSTNQNSSKPYYRSPSEAKPSITSLQLVEKINESKFSPGVVDNDGSIEVTTSEVNY